MAEVERVRGAHVLEGQLGAGAVERDGGEVAVGGGGAREGVGALGGGGHLVAREIGGEQVRVVRERRLQRHRAVGVDAAADEDDVLERGVELEHAGEQPRRRDGEALHGEVECGRALLHVEGVAADLRELEACGRAWKGVWKSMEEHGRVWKGVEGHGKGEGIGEGGAPGTCSSGRAESRRCREAPPR